DWPGSIAIKAGIVDTKGSEAAFSLSINQLSAQGSLRELPVQLDLSSVVTEDSIELQDARLSSGSSTVELNGRLARSGSDFDWSTYIPDITLLYPDMSGQIGGSGKFTGSMHDPELTGAIELSNIR